MAKKKSAAKNGNGDLEFADRLWSAANRLRGTVGAAEYKHIVLFLKYLSDAFENRHRFLTRAVTDPANTEYFVKEAPAEYIASVAEDKDEYLAANVFWIPPQARWSYLLANAHQPYLGRLIDEAMAAIEKENPKQLRGVLPKIYARTAIPAQTLGELLNLFSAVDLVNGDAVARDVLGRTYEYFIKMFAKAEGCRGGEFYTPQCVVRLLVEMLEPYRGRAYDPACGSGGMFVQSRRFVEAHNGNPNDISIYGQECNEAT